MSTFFSNQSLRQNSDLKGIFDYYIKPFVKFFLDRDMVEKNTDIIDIFFHGADRKILTAEAVEGFRMPGMFKRSALKHVSGIKHMVKPGDRLYMRLDCTMPDRIDVEVLVPKGSLVFCLTNKQFQQIMKKVTVKQN